MILIHESGSQVFIDIKKFDKFKSLNADSVGSLYFIPAMIQGYVLPCLLAKPIWRIQLIYTYKLITETRYVYMMHSAAMAVADMTGMICHGPLARYVQLHVAPGMPGMFSLPPWDVDPDMHHGTCVTHVPWCMPGSLINGVLLKSVAGNTLPAFPAHAQPAILLIW